MSTMFISISGPSDTGKSSLVGLLGESLRGKKGVYLGSDLHEHVWNSLLRDGIFTEFSEITKDRDYLYLYIARLVSHYKSVLEDFSSRGEDSIVILDGCHLDLLIYSMLNLWYHYPTKELQELTVRELLGLKDQVSLIYMTTPDDEQFSSKEESRRRRSTAFKRDRNLEITYYDIFRSAGNVVSIPHSSILDAETFIMNDLKERGILL